MKTIKVILSATGILLFFILLASIGLWVYVKFIAPDSFKETTIYANQVEDTNGKKAICEVVAYDNADGSGIQLLDIKLNYYSDFNATNVVASGIQIIDGTKNLKSDHPSEIVKFFVSTKNYDNFIAGEVGKQNYNNQKLCFYEANDKLSYAGVNNKFDNFGLIRVEIEGKIYALKFGKEISANTPLWMRDSYVSSLSLFAKQLEEIVMSMPVGQDEQTIKFEDMFEIYEFTGNKYELVSNTDLVTSYLYIDFTHYTTGAKTAQDSVFGQIQYNTNFVVDGANALDEHFSDKAIFNIDEQYLEFIFNEEKQAHYFDLQEKSYNYLKDKNLNIELTIDLDYLKENNIAFGGVVENSKLKTLGVTSYFTISNGVKSEVQL